MQPSGGFKENKLWRQKGHLLYHREDDVSQLLEPVLLCHLQHLCCTAEGNDFVLEVLFAALLQDDLDNVTDTGLVRHWFLQLSTETPCAWMVNAK